MFDEKTNGIIAGVWVTLSLVAIVIGEGAAAKLIGVMLLIGLGAFLFVSIKSSLETARERRYEFRNSLDSQAAAIPAMRSESGNAKPEWPDVPKSNAKVVYHSAPPEKVPSRTVYSAGTIRKDIDATTKTHEIGTEKPVSSFVSTGATDFFLQNRVQPKQNKLNN